MGTVIRYRLHTQHSAPTLVPRYFEGFSILTAKGYFRGRPEASIVIEIIGSLSDADKVRALAHDIREQYRQAEVWITTEEVSLTRVTIDAVKEGLES